MENRAWWDVVHGKILACYQLPALKDEALTTGRNIFDLIDAIQECVDCVPNVYLNGNGLAGQCLDV